MKRPLQIVVAAAMAVASVGFAWYRIAHIPRVPRAKPWEGGNIAAMYPPMTANEPVTANAAVNIQDDDLVVGVVVNGHPRAYPMQLIFMNEVLNDQLGGEPVCVTWCALTLSGVVFSRRAGDDPHHEFSRSAIVHQGNLMMVDQRTQSEWSQLGHGAVKGKLEKTRLTILPSVQTTWLHWRHMHPDSEVLDLQAVGPAYWYVGENANVGVEEVDLVIGIDTPAVKAYPFSELDEHPLSDRVGDLDIRVHFDPTAHTAWITDVSGNLLPAVTTIRSAWSKFNQDSDYYTRVGGEKEKIEAENKR